MIKLLELKNFKSIKNHLFRLRNLNVMFGLNGMGKSTFIQSLLLLKQSDKLRFGELKLNGEFIEIGKGKDAFYQYSKEDELMIDIHFTDGQKKRFDFEYKSESDYFDAKSTEKIESSFFEESLFQYKFKYLSSFRIEPRVIHKNSYKEVVDNRNVGINGEYTIHFLNYYGNTEIAFENLKHKNSGNLSIIEQVNNWMGEISPGVKFNTTEIVNSDNFLLDIQFKQENLGFTNHFRPTNVGYGISHVLPIVTTLLSARPEDLIIIENPEAYIHPRGQVELGKLIALAANNDIQIIVESHSDHILNGIRVAIKYNLISKDDAIIFYFEKELKKNEQYSKITHIQVDKNGELSNYPKNLLDEWGNQMLKLV